MITNCLSVVQPGTFGYNYLASEIMLPVPEPLGLYYFGVCKLHFPNFDGFLWWDVLTPDTLMEESRFPQVCLTHHLPDVSTTVFLKMTWVIILLSCYYEIFRKCYHCTQVKSNRWKGAVCHTQATPSSNSYNNSEMWVLQWFQAFSRGAICPKL